jgi:hypothetical protein
MQKNLRVFISTALNNRGCTLYLAGIVSTETHFRKEFYVKLSAEPACFHGRQLYRRLQTIRANEQLYGSGQLQRSEVLLLFFDENTRKSVAGTSVPGQQ